MSESLVGGVSRTAGGRRRPSEALAAPVKVGYRFLITLVVLAGMFTALGAWKINTVFAIRDREQETRRLQELSQERRDRSKTIAARVSQLQRAEMLRATAETRLGMADPEPGRIETLSIPQSVQDRWTAAAQKTNGKSTSTEDTTSP